MEQQGIDWATQARLANQQGVELWQQGELEQAVTRWQAASLAYQKAGDWEGVLGSGINQAMALRSLGLLSQSEALLLQIDQQLDAIESGATQALARRQLASTLRQLGKLKQAEIVLKAGLDAVADPTERGRMELELGNVYRVQAKQAADLGQQELTRARVEAATLAYGQAAQHLSQSEAVMAQLNRLGLWVETQQRSVVMAQLPELRSRLNLLPADRFGVNARLNLAHSLLCLEPDSFQSCPRIVLGPPEHGRAAAVPPRQIAALLIPALEQARALGDRRAESYALGQLGVLYAQTQQTAEAQRLTQQAVLTLEGVRAPEIRYLWEWQQGKLYAQQQRFSQALSAYRASVKTLETARQDLLTIDPDVQFSFRDNVEPVYRELIDLLLRDNPDGTSNSARLQEAIDQANALKLAELENFLGCSLSYNLKLDQALDELDPTAAFLYPIVLGDRLEVVFKLPGQLLQHWATPVEQAEVEDSLAELRRSLLGRDVSAALLQAGRAYDWLIRPLEAGLPDAGVETLVFVLDGSLRDIPMSVLYDTQTEEYLIEKPYSTVLLPSADLFDLRPSRRRQRVLGAGVSEARVVDNRQFGALNTDRELAAIGEATVGDVLLNGQFTLTNVKQRLRQTPASVVHVASHGKFSSDPTETYILAYDELLRVPDLEALLQAAQTAGGSFPGDAEPALELLVLSACETALGDNRATLGLAGLAVRSGAKSTLATLWQVSDDSTVALMEQFYRNFGASGLAKAEALQQAQRQLLQQPQYQNPFYWAPYVLVGNWR